MIHNVPRRKKSGNGVFDDLDGNVCQAETSKTHNLFK